MSQNNSIICDRCGRQTKSFKRSHIFARKPFYIIQKSIAGFGAHDYTEKQYDLCDSCEKGFEKWMKEVDNP